MNMTLSSRVAAPRDQVFDLFSDFPNAPERVSGIESVEMLTDGPVDKGTRFRETRIMFKREATEEFEVTAFERPSMYTVSGNSCGCEWGCTFRFEPDGDATNVTMEMRNQPVTFFAKLMSPMGKLMAGSMKKCVQQDLDDLKRVAEGGASGQVAPAAG